MKIKLSTGTGEIEDGGVNGSGGLLFSRSVGCPIAFRFRVGCGDKISIRLETGPWGTLGNRA